MARAPAVQEIEELPEADRLAGYPHPRETKALYGHEDAERALVEAFASGRIHHGWLIEGAEGIGKATLAYRFACFLLARLEERDPFGMSLHIPDEAPAARLVRARAHPGLLVVRRTYDTKAKRFTATIPVDEVRRLRAFLGHTSEEGAWRIVIVDTADDMNLSAANALLKSLEEPPTRTIFLLVSSAPGRLLPTIRSRCRTLALAPLSSEALKKAVTQAIAQSGEEIAGGTPSPAAWDKLERLSAGSVRRVLSLMATGGLDLHERAAKIVSLLPKVDWGVVHALGDELGGAAVEQRFELFFELLLGLLARLVRASATGEGAAGDLALAKRLIPEARLAAWAEVWDTLGAEKATAEALNLDRKSLILETVSRLETVARG